VKVFIDSGGWLSVVIESDQYHEAGRSNFEALMALASALETSDFVLDEVVTRLRYDVGHGKAVEFLGLVRTLVLCAEQSTSYHRKGIEAGAQ